MKVVVRLFAGARDAVGQAEVEIEIPENSSIRLLRQSLLEHYPALDSLLPHTMFAINADYATDETPVPTDAEIACIPPVSGG
ncbi:MAG: MoaD/ThiS family protein [Pirellulales bacterium]|nr:MoaD/ThiS family protein [Pirellulales bacterium]